MPSPEIPAIEDLDRLIDELTHEIAATPRTDPRRLEMVDQIASLKILTESLKKNRE
jgi:hypothetical protein